MKKVFSIAIAALLISTVSFAKVWRVNNNGGVNANFTTAQAAVSSSSVVNGDTLYFEGSTTSYGDIADLNKSLTLIGTGYFLGNWSPTIQFTPISARLGNISNVTVPNVQIMGLELSNIYLSAGNFQMFRSNAYSVNLWGVCPNVVIKQNWIGSFGASGNEYVTNLLISNNLIGSGISFYGGNDNGVIEYNDWGIQNNCTINFALGNFSFRNNIIGGATSQVQNYVNSSVQYNMAQSNTLPANNFNQNSVNMAGSAVFSNNDYTAGDKGFVLSANSPALTAGANATPIGAFSGASPYIFSGIPPIPTIYSLSMPAATVTGSTIQVTFSSRVNN